MNHLLILIEFASIVLVLIIILIVFGIIKRTDGIFCHSSKILAFGFVLFAFDQIMHILIDINYLKNEMWEIVTVFTEFIFIVVILIGLYRLAYSIKEVHDGGAKES